MLKKTLNLEALEPRLAMTSGLTAVLDGALLSITGTTGNDVLTIDYDATQLTIVELNQSYPLKGLKTIEILTGGGDDTVQLNFMGPKKAKWLRVAINLHAQGGSDQLLDAVGNEYYFGGEQDVLAFSRKGKGRINGSKLSWFDTSLNDATLRAEVKNAYTDKVLSRSDMLTLFDIVADDDIVRAEEFTSLQAVADNKSLFRKLEDVYILTGYVVNGTVANQFFQQDTLGNLTAGASGEQLERLVDKWFLGKDVPDSSDLDTGVPYAYREVSGSLFVNGASYLDIRQGNVGDCYLLAGLGAIAVHSPKTISSMFIVNGDGTYTIRFYDDKTPYYITVDARLPVNQWDRLVFASAGLSFDDPANELWVPLIEKAYAQLAEFGWLDTGGGAVNAYAAIDAGWPGDAMLQATGKAVQDVLALDSEKVISKAFSADRAITFITPSQPASADIVSDHVYAMVGYNPRTREFLLFNPWGINNGSVPGIVTFTWEQIQQNFYAWDYGPKV